MLMRMLSGHGREGRLGYLLISAFCTAGPLLVLYGLTDVLSPNKAGAPSLGEMIFFLVVVAAVVVFSIYLNIVNIVRRFHDLDKPATYIFIFFIPIISLIWMFMLTFKRGDEGENMFGSPPAVIKGEVGWIILLLLGAFLLQDKIVKSSGIKLFELGAQRPTCVLMRKSDESKSSKTAVITIKPEDSIEQGSDDGQEYLSGVSGDSQTQEDPDFVEIPVGERVLIAEEVMEEILEEQPALEAYSPSILSEPLLGTRTVILKSGTIVKGEIIEQGSDYIKMNFQGIALTYYNDEIETIK